MRGLDVIENQFKINKGFAGFFDLTGIGTGLKSWKKEEIGFLLVFPNVKEVGQASLGMRIVENIAREIPGYFVDTLYYTREQFMRGPVPRSTFASAPASSFSFMGFSCSFEMDYQNVLQILSSSGIPIYSREREKLRCAGNFVPYVIGGGIGLSANPRPMIPFFDFIFLFDSEFTLKPFLKSFLDKGFDAGSASKWWYDAGTLPRGIIPSFLFDQKGLDGILSGETCHWVARHMDEHPVQVLHGGSLDSREGERAPSLGNVFFLELGRGCRESCRFCLLSHHQRPPRHPTLQKVQDAIDLIVQQGGPYWRKISMIGSNVADHPNLPEICDYILENGLKFSLPSIKPTTDRKFFESLNKSGIHTITIAPETGSERLRAGINKKISNCEYFVMVKELLAHGVKAIKMYLIHGLPSEVEEDLGDTREFVRAIHSITRDAGARFSVSVNPFIPKLGTPFMFHTGNYMSPNFPGYKRQFKNFLNSLGKIVKVKVNSTSAKHARVQAALSLGGVELAEYLARDLHSTRKIEIPVEIMDEIFQYHRDLLQSKEIPPTLACLLPTGFDYLKREYELAMAGIFSSRCDGGRCGRCTSWNCTKD
ncbi:MAG: B12-binding domain-containing radical SAM protein [Promethearchaeota archaeon]